MGHEGETSVGEWAGRDGRGGFRAMLPRFDDDDFNCCYY